MQLALAQLAIEGGEFEEATLLGRSAVYDPRGTRVATAGDWPDLVTASVTADRIRQCREEFPAATDRRGRDPAREPWFYNLSGLTDNCR